MPPSQNLTTSRLETLPHWEYRGEGNANLVISLPDSKIILRFHKSKGVKESSTISETHESKVRKIGAFTNGVMAPLLGTSFVRPLSLGVISKPLQNSIFNSIEPLRPLKRRIKKLEGNSVIVSSDCAFLPPELEKLTSGPTISIEIKPKDGCLPKTSSKTLCHLCLKQFVKGLTSSRLYCPMDLFSGNIPRMKRALSHLLLTPSNRYKIFRNGRLLYGEEFSSSESLQSELSSFFNCSNSEESLNHLNSLLIASLLQRTSADEILTDVEISGNCRSEDYCDESSLSLPTNSILYKLLSIQKSSNLTDESALSIVNKHSAYTEFESESESNENSKFEVRQLEKYLLAKTAKDASLFLTFRKIKKDFLVNFDEKKDAYEISLVGQKYCCSISVIDLDPKPLQRIPKWMKRKEEWNLLYKEVKSQKI